MNKFLVETFSYLRKQLQSYLNEEFKDYNLKSSEIFFMQLLHNNGPLSQIEISKLLECDKAHIHRTVSRLIEKGYVVRLDEKEHIKNSKLLLTQSGQELSIKVEKAINKWNKFMLKGVSDEDIKIARKVAIKIFENACNFKKNGEQKCLNYLNT